MARVRERWPPLIPQIDAVEAALQGLEEKVGTWWLEDLKNTLADMRRTILDWTQSGGQADGNHSEPVAPKTPAQEPDYQIYLWIDGVRGEIATVHYGRWIEALSYRQSLSRPTDSEEVLQPTFAIEKYVDQASPALYHAVRAGRVFTKVRIDVCRSTAAAECFLRIEMSDAAILEVSQAAYRSSGRVRPTETVLFEYQRIRWTYTKLRPEDAVSVGNTSSTWTRSAAAPEAKPRNKG